MSLDTERPKVYLESGELIEWMEDRGLLQGKWRAEVRAFRTKIQEKLDEAGIKCSSEVSYFKCKEMIRCFEEKEMSEHGNVRRTMFGGYVSNDLSDLVRLEAFAMNKNLHMADVSLFISQIKEFELSSIEKEIRAIITEKVRLTKKLSETRGLLSKAEEKLQKMHKENNIESSDVSMHSLKRALLKDTSALVDQLISIELMCKSDSIKRSIEFYRGFVQSCVETVVELGGRAPETCPELIGYLKAISEQECTGTVLDDVTVPEDTQTEECCDIQVTGKAETNQDPGIPKEHEDLINLMDDQKRQSILFDIEELYCFLRSRLDSMDSEDSRGEIVLDLLRMKKHFIAVQDKLVIGSYLKAVNALLDALRNEGLQRKLSIRQNSSHLDRLCASIMGQRALVDSFKGKVDKLSHRIECSDEYLKSCLGKQSLAKEKSTKLMNEIESMISILTGFRVYVN